MYGTKASLWKFLLYLTCEEKISCTFPQFTIIQTIYMALLKAPGMLLFENMIKKGSDKTCNESINAIMLGS